MFAMLDANTKCGLWYRVDGSEVEICFGREGYDHGPTARVRSAATSDVFTLLAIFEAARQITELKEDRPGFGRWSRSPVLRRKP